jgi:uncharacterized protein (DUF488 family)
MNRAAGPLAVFTIGHGDRSFGDLESRLAPHRIQAIVDVRSVPYSRHAPDFTKSELEAITAEAGLGYRWLGDHLGGRPEDPAVLTAGAPDAAKIRADPSFQAGIEEVLAIARTSRVVLLCAEIDHHNCHRSEWIAPALEAADVRVWHIDGSGEASAHQPDLGL